MIVISYSLQGQVYIKGMIGERDGRENKRKSSESMWERRRGHLTSHNGRQPTTVLQSTAKGSLGFVGCVLS